MGTAPAKVAFELKEHFNRVEIAVQGSDKNLVVTDSGYETSDPGEIRELDLSPGVKRVSKESKASDGGDK